MLDFAVFNDKGNLPGASTLEAGLKDPNDYKDMINIRRLSEYYYLGAPLYQAGISNSESIGTVCCWLFTETYPF